MATEKILNLWEEARAGDITSDKDLVTTVAIGILRDQNQLGLKEVAVELKLLGDGEIPLEKKAELDPRKFNIPATSAMQVVCEERYESFGTAGNASKINPLPLTTMAKRYNSGELDQTIN